MAGSSFLLARSPVTPNSTSTHGPATRGILRSRGSRSGLNVMRFLRRFFCSGSGSMARRGGHLVADRLEKLVPRGLELLHALDLQHLHDVVVVDPERLQVREHLAGRVVGAVDRVAVQRAVVC